MKTSFFKEQKQVTPAELSQLADRIPLLLAIKNDDRKAFEQEFAKDNTVVFPLPSGGHTTASAILGFYEHFDYYSGVRDIKDPDAWKNTFDKLNIAQLENDALKAIDEGAEHHPVPK